MRSAGEGLSLAKSCCVARCVLCYISEAGRGGIRAAGRSLLLIDGWMEGTEGVLSRPNLEALV